MAIPLRSYLELFLTTMKLLLSLFDVQVATGILICDIFFTFRRGLKGFLSCINLIQPDISVQVLYTFSIIVLGEFV